MNIDFKKQKGFTIIELIIAIFILSVAIVGIFGAFSMMIVLTANASDRLTAAYLAQEGIEIIRNIRDGNWINSDINPDTKWVQGFEMCTSDIGGCEADYTTGTNATGAWAMAPGQNDYLKINNSTGFYNYSNGTKTKFKRQILFSYIPGIPYIAKITVNVYWDEKASLLNPTGGLAGQAGSGLITVEEYFYDWYNYSPIAPNV